MKRYYFSLVFKPLRCSKEDRVKNFPHDDFGQKVSKTTKRNIVDLTLGYISISNLCKLHHNIKSTVCEISLKITVTNWVFFKDEGDKSHE